MIALVPLAAWLAATALPAAECVLPPGPELARAGDAVVTPGAVTIAGRRLTRCDRLPGAHPIAVAAWRGGHAIGFRDAGVWVLRDGELSPLRGLPPAPIRALASAGERLWIGTGTAGLWWSDGGGAQRFAHRVLGRRGITALARRGDALEVGVDPQGLWRVDASGRARRLRRTAVGCFRGRGRAPRPPGPACQVGDGGGVPYHVTALASHRGRLVVATFDQGVHERRGAGFRPVPGSPRFVNALLSVGDQLYIGAAEGLYRRRGDGPATRVVLGSPSEHVNGLAAGPDGALWIATSDGLVSLRAGRVRVLDTGDGLPSRLVYAVAVAADGAVWAGTAAGAVRFSGRGAALYSHSSGALPHDWVTALLPDGDGVYAGTYDAGVARLDPEGGGAPVPAFGGAWVNPGGLARVGGELLATTLGGGLVRVRAGQRLPAPRLPSADVTAALATAEGLWIGTRGGLARLLL